MRELRGVRRSALIDSLRDPSPLPSRSAVTDAAEGPIVPVRYIITKSDQYSDADTDPDPSCMPQDNLTVSCPGQDGRLFDMVDSSRNRNMKWKISHHWRSSQGRENVHVELVFSCPVTISAMTWHFFQDSDAYVPSSSNWSVTAIAQTDTNSTSRYIKAMTTSQGEAFKLSMSNISGFPASSHWRIIIPLPLPSNWLFLNELDTLGEMNRIGENRGTYIVLRAYSCISPVASPSSGGSTHSYHAESVTTVYYVAYMCFYCTDSWIFILRELCCFISGALWCVSLHLTIILSVLPL